MTAQLRTNSRGYFYLGELVLPEMLVVAGHELVRKAEFHITIIGANAHATLLARAETQEVIERAVAEFTEAHDLTRFVVTDEFRLLRRDGFATLIVMVDLPEIIQLYSFLNQKFGVALSVQPPHITLYAPSPDAGMFLNSAEQLADETEIVELPELVRAFSHSA